MQYRLIKLQFKHNILPRFAPMIPSSLDNNNNNNKILEVDIK